MRTSRIPTLGRSSRRGMTLIEIMIVLAILATLMTVLALGIVGRLDDANVETTRLTMSNIKGELEIYRARHKGKFPATSEGLAAAYKGKEIPKDAWGNDFQYFSPGSHGDNDYELISLGKDGAEGGDGYDADIKSWEEPEEGN